MIRAVIGRRLAGAAAAAALALPATVAVGEATGAEEFASRPASDEVIYFLLPDRFENGDRANDQGGLEGDRLVTGYDPTDRGFYHGGDLTGLIQRLDYIQGLGATALWIAPVFANKPVQGAPGQESAAYHGYWITDFTRVDPHLGTNADFKALVDAAHARGMKVYLDIVINHTADVIRYRECPGWECDYRWRGDYPYTRRGGLDGDPINEGFRDDEPGTYGALTQPDYAYTPYVPEAERDIKAPAWLNDVGLYHNRGNSVWRGESALDGDFAGLDDVMTEHPRVVEGMIELYAGWIRDYGIDGYRIDTARHVNPEFWQAFVPAIQKVAAEAGRPNFHIFGEVYSFDAAELARHTHVDRLPSVIDFAFQKAVREAVAGTAGPDRLAALYAADAVYAGGEATALTLPTFVGNHDMGRFAHLLLSARPDISDDELLARTTLANAMMMFGRGPPVIYYGDEQGFTGDGDDKRARQDMFETRTPDYADDRRVGEATGPFDTEATLYRRIAELARIRQADQRLRRGRTVVRRADPGPGLLAVSRLDGGGETLVVYNTSTEAMVASVPVDPASAAWRGVSGECPAVSAAPGAVRVSVGPLQYLVCVSEGSR